jgi:hypothetical protein
MAKLDNSFDNLDKIVNKTLKNLREGIGDIPGEDPNIVAGERYEQFVSSVENSLSYEFKSNPGFKEFCDENYDLIDEYAKREYQGNQDPDDAAADILQAFKESDDEYNDMEQRDAMERAFQSGEYSALEEGKKNKAKSQISEAKRMKLLAGLITESQLNEGYKFADANEDKAKEIEAKIKPAIESVLKKTMIDIATKNPELQGAGAANFGLAVGLIAYQIVMDSI